MKGQGLQTRASDDFILIAESADAVKKWRADKSIPMVDVVNSFQVFVTDNHGAQGKLDTASNGTLENEFGTHNEDEVVKQILEKGEITETMSHDKQGSKNESHGARNAF